MENNTIVKGRKYMLQFPEGVKAEDKAAYLKEVKTQFENDDFVSIDSKIKVFPKDEYSAPAAKPDAKADDKVDAAADDKKVEDKKVDADVTPEPTTTPVTKATANVNVVNIGKSDDPVTEPTTDESFLGDN
jgi:hypothetical protein